jgi:hypothetical protein
MPRHTEPVKEFFALRLEPRQLAGLRAVQKKLGVTVAEQLRRLVDAYLLRVEAANRRARPRRKKMKGRS